MGLRGPSGKKMKTTIWGFEYKGRVYSPGPTLVARNGTHTFVRWENRLPRGPHLLPVDRTLHVPNGYDPETGGLPLVIHLHGGHTEWESDGHPEAWFTQNFAKRGKFFRKETYDYDNSEDATLLWYHDHVMGMTRLNNYAGLTGLYLIEDETEARLHRLNLLPNRSDTLELMIMDKLFITDGSVYYPGVHGEPVSLVEIEPQWPNPTQLHEFWGQFVTVNGMVWPRVEVDPKAYRLRMLNASDTRTYVFTFANGMRFWKVGGDGGFLDAAVEITHLVLAPAQRADVVVDFSAYAGDQIVLNNEGGDVVFKGFVPPDDPSTARATVNPVPGYVLSDGQGGTTKRADAETTGVVMRFDVKASTPRPGAEGGGAEGGGALALPGTPLLAVPMPRWSPAQADKTRQLALFKGTDQYGRNALLLGTLSAGSLTFDDPVTEVVNLDTVEIWEIYNATVSGHPIHLHLVEFQVLNREPFAAPLHPKQHKSQKIQGGTLTDVRLTGDPVPPSPAESGQRDTVIALPGQVTRLIAYFDRPGHYVWHCHLLSHEDWDMMRKLRILST